MKKPEKFNTPEEVLQYFRSISEDIESVQIPVTKQVQIIDSSGNSTFMPNVGLVFRTIGGQTGYIHVRDAEIVLKDGLFERMKIEVTEM